MPRVKKRLPSVADEGKQWSVEQKMDACIKYMETGNMSLVSRELGIPRNTLVHWKSTEWWHKAMADIRDEMNISTEAQLGQTANRALRELEDRLTSGDVIYNSKTDTFKRVPVRAAVVNQILKNAAEQRSKLQERSTKEAFSDKAVTERLRDLAEEFVKFSRAKTLVQDEPQKSPEMALIGPMDSSTDS